LQTPPIITLHILFIYNIYDATSRSFPIVAFCASYPRKVQSDLRTI
jgi:hypothetical protein